MLCNVTSRLGDGQRVILCQRVRGSVRAVRAVRNTGVFLTETRVVADVPGLSSALPVPLKAGRNALLGSDTLLKLMHLSLHSTSSQTLLEASSD